MIRPAPFAPLVARRSLGLAGAVVGRAAFALAALAALALPVLAGPALKGDVTAARDVLTLGDLVAGVPAEVASQPLFRAPALGQTGTVQAARVVEAARGLGLEVETGGRAQVTVTRAARRVGAAEIETALRAALAPRVGLAPEAITIAFDGPMPSLVAPPDLGEPVVAADLAYDPRGRRVAALVTVGRAEARSSLRVSGTVVETVEVAVLARALARGEAASAADLLVERRPREGLPSDVQSDPAALAGQVARRSLPSGTVVRSGDLAKREVVARGEAVLIVFEAPGISLTLRGRANEAGAMGESIAVMNPTTKKILQAVVTGPGRVAVEAASHGRVAAR